MEIIEYGDFSTCDANNFLKLSISFKDNVSKMDLYKLSKGKQLIFNEKIPIPFFKIISQMFTIRGSLETNRITIEFNSADRAVCEQELKKIFK